MIFLRGSSESHLDIFSILRDNYPIIFSIVILNALMLLFGYLGEKNIIPLVWGVLIGFIPFIIYYYLIYNNFVKSRGNAGANAGADPTTANINNTILKLFLYFLFFWSLYGIVGLLPYYIKNTIYNILDLFSKNFFGLLLSYLIITKSITTS
jgi:hypothetical protein